MRDVQAIVDEIDAEVALSLKSGTAVLLGQTVRKHWPALKSALSPAQPQPQGDESPGDVIAATADGGITLDDGIETTSYPRACAFLHAALSSAQARVAELEADLRDAMLLAGMNQGAVKIAEDFRAERDRERAARKEMQRLYEHRGAALLRPCISCGYQPKVVAASNAAQDPT
jgi:hypothetical protein